MGRCGTPWLGPAALTPGIPSLKSWRAVVGAALPVLVATYPFHCSSELEAVLALHGFAAHVVQLQPGPMQGSLQLAANAGVPALRLQCTTAYSLSCARSPQILPLSLERRGHGDQVLIHGQPLVPHAVAGCCLNLSHSFVQIWPQAEALIALLPRERLLERLVLGDGAGVVALMEQHNQVLLPASLHRQLVAWLASWFEVDGLVEMDPLACWVECLKDAQILGAVPLRLIQRYELVAQMISLGADATGAGAIGDLNQLVAHLGVSRRSLIQGCKELTGLGPMQLLRAQRLERVHQELQLAADDSVAAIAARHGFLSRGHFSSLYQRQYGMLPSATAHRSDLAA